MVKYMNPSYFRIKLPMDQLYSAYAVLREKRRRKQFYADLPKPLVTVLMKKSSGREVVYSFMKTKAGQFSRIYRAFYAGMPAKVGKNLHNRRISWRRDIMMQYCMVSWW